MNRRDFLKLGAAAPVARRVAAAASKPNIVLFLADDLGFGDLSSYGATDIRTPRIDSIGQQGVRFTNFYNNAPECTPTRTALLTGRYQHRVGGLECAIGVGEVGRYDEAEWLAKRGELGLPSTERTMAQIFASAGYDTACIGKWHLGYRQKFQPRAHGWSEHFGILGGNADYFTHLEEGGAKVLAHNGKLVDREGYLTDLFGDAAVEWLEGRKSDRPFLLYLPFNAPHTPIQAPDDPAVRQGHRPTYARMVERMDYQVGRVLDRLKAMGAARDTLVIFASDNGADANGRNDPYRGRKGTLWEGGIRSPLLVRWPSTLKQGATVGQLGMTMDLLPTMLAAAGIRENRVTFDGIDLLPAMRGEKPVERTVFWRYKRLENRRKAVRRGNLKLVIDNGREELHDVAKDPNEQNNLLPGASAQAAELRKLLEIWEREVAAPRLRDFSKVSRELA